MLPGQLPDEDVAGHVGERLPVPLDASPELGVGGLLVAGEVDAEGIGEPSAVLLVGLEDAQGLAVDLVEVRIVAVLRQVLELAHVLEPMLPRPGVQLVLEVVLRVVVLEAAQLLGLLKGERVQLHRGQRAVATQAGELRLEASELGIAASRCGGRVGGLQRLADDALRVAMEQVGGDTQDELPLTAVRAFLDVLRHQENGGTQSKLQGATSSRGPDAQGAQGARFVPRSDALKSRYAVD